MENSRRRGRESPRIMNIRSVLVASLIVILTADVSPSIDVEDDVISMEARNRASTKPDHRRGNSSTSRAPKDHKVAAINPPAPCADASVASVLFGGCDSAVFCPDPAVISPESLATVEDQYFPRSGRIQVGERRVSLCTRRSPTSNQPQLTDLVEEQWRQIQLPAPVIEVQPADHRTLVNQIGRASCRKEWRNCRWDGS